MEVFTLTLRQMLMMFTLIAVGFLLRRKFRFPQGSDVTLSKLETCVFVPALTLYNQMTRCTVENFSKNWQLMLYGLALTLCAILIAYPVSALFVRRHRESSALAYQRNIYKYATAFGNYGFMGNFIVLGVWGADMFYKYSLLTFCVGILNSSWGLYTLIPKEKNAGIPASLKRALTAPPMLALMIGMAAGLTGLGSRMPEFLISAFQSAGNCQGPVAMLLAGYVIGGYRFGELLSNKKVYIITALRLIVIPAAAMLVLRLIGASREIMTLALILLATPLGLNTIVFPAAYGGDTKTGASMAMISHTLCVVTIPLMYLLFIEIL